MKIGILTFHSALNYGAVLQAYASVRFLQSLGHEAYVVDYKNPAISRAFHPFKWDADRWKKSGLKYLVKYPFRVLAKYRRSRAFSRFVRRQLPLIPFSRAESLDLLLVGSDQVWSKRHTGGQDPVYWGRAFPGIRKVAWAASAGKSMLDQTDIQTLMRHFSAISVRESKLTDLIPQSVLLPDPTLLLDPAEWEKLVRPVHGRYVLAYPMAYEHKVLEKARRKAQDMGIGLKVIAPYVKLGSGWIQTASPVDFLSLIHSAEYVVTSSFHGALFALLFDRPHSFVFHEDPRFETLLNTGWPSAADKAKAFLFSALDARTPGK